MRVSVAMTTYNGKGHLPEQLDSILGQFRQPDEIVVRDDNSTDGTFELLEDYAGEYDLITVRRNAENVGLAENFARVIQDCTGDVICLSDQDDVWDPEKIKRQVERYQQEDVDLVCHNARLMEDGSLGGTLWDSLHVHDTYRASPIAQLAELTRGNYIQGASMLFDSGLAQYLGEFPAGYHYDHYIALLAAARRGIAEIDDCLSTYRIHDGQAMGFSTLSRAVDLLTATPQEMQEKVTRWDALLDVASQFGDDERLLTQQQLRHQVSRRRGFDEQRYHAVESGLAGVRDIVEGRAGYRRWSRPSAAVVDALNCTRRGLVS